MFANLSGWHLLILLAVVLLLFGAAKLPALAKSVGQSARILKGEMREAKASSPSAGEGVDSPNSIEASTTRSEKAGTGDASTLAAG